MDALPGVTPLPATGKTATVEIFDPPLCCPTGVCGPTVDSALLDVMQVITTLNAQGIPVARYQMMSAPQAFLRNPEVVRLVRTQQVAALPITVIAGRIIKTGAYPTLAEVEHALRGDTP
jgi:Arsenical resistance operon protein ArsD